ncbi:MAG: prohibitin family protein [Bacteroides sp.]|nr:prohibitin family protein [Bacteroides sp.]
MIFLIIGIVIAAVAFGLLGIDGNSLRWKVCCRQAFSVIPLIIALAISMVAFVPTGCTGILTTFGKVEDRTVQAGINIIAPWQKVVKMDNRTQKQFIETQAFSSDIQQVDVAVTLNYCIDKNTAQNLYSSVGVDYYNTILNPRALEGIKTVFAGYSAEELVTNRVELSGKIAAIIADDVSEYGIQISGVSIENLDFTDAFTDAVEAKQVATQNKLTAETEQAKLTLEAEAAAERQIIAANAEAEANRIIAASITPELIQMKEAEARMEHGWVTVQGAGSTVVKAP